MEDTSGLFPKDIHSFLRTFIPGSIFIIVFLCIVAEPVLKEGVTLVQLKNISGGLVLVLVTISYILGNLIAWISHVFLHRGFQYWTYCSTRPFRYKLLYDEVEELNKIFKRECGEEKKYFRKTNERRKIALLYDYFLHNERMEVRNNDENNIKINLKTHRERIFFIMSRIHSIYASVVGIILAIIIGGLWILHTDKCLNEMPWWIAGIWGLIAVVIYLFYRILRNNVITYENIFIKINRKDLIELRERL